MEEKPIVLSGMRPSGKLHIGHLEGVLRDKIIDKAISSFSPVAVMPCCYNQDMKKYNLKDSPDKRKLTYKDEKDYFDAFRLQYLKEHGFQTHLKRINQKITPMNNVLIGIPND